MINDRREKTTLSNNRTKSIPAKKSRNEPISNNDIEINILKSLRSEITVSDKYTCLIHYAANSGTAGN